MSVPLNYVTLRQEPSVHETTISTPLSENKKDLVVGGPAPRSLVRVRRRLHRRPSPLSPA